MVCCRANFAFLPFTSTVSALQSTALTSLSDGITDTTEKVKLSHYRPGQALGVPEVEAPEFLDNLHMKVVRLSALRTGRLYPQEGSLVLISVRDLVDPRATMPPEELSHRKNSSDFIGNRTRDLPVCSAVPQPTAPPRTPNYFSMATIIRDRVSVLGYTFIACFVYI
jgi:hypothetical protein